MRSEHRPASDTDPGLEARLRALRVDPPERGFSERLHLRLAAAGQPLPAGPLERLRAALGPRPTGRPALALSLSALAAAAALVLALSWPALRRPHGEVAVAVPSSQVALVRLRIDADVAVAAADIRVTLPDGLAFWSDGQALADRRIEWTQPLAAGANEIPLAVKGARPGRYRMVVTAQLGRSRVEHEVVLEVTRG